MALLRVAIIAGLVCLALAAEVKVEEADGLYRPGRAMGRERERARIRREEDAKTNWEASLDYDNEGSGNGNGNFGIDIAIWTVPSQSQWECMQKANYSLAVIEGWNGGRGLNQNLASVASAAWSAGFTRVDVYAFMCPNCNNSPSSVTTLVNSLKQHNVNFGTVWLDIEQCTGCWGSTSSNVEFIQSLVNVYQQNGVNIGIYSSQGEWEAVTGNTATFSNLDLWYAHYDGEPNFNDWHSGYVGHWSKPTMKQFMDHADNTCGTSVDRDWFP